MDARIARLELLVKRQSELLSKTGQQVLALTVERTKTQVEELAPPVIPGVTPETQSIDTSEFVVNDDIVQLVKELQGQLDNLETRSIRRGVNIMKTDPRAMLAPMLNNDGEVPPEAMWPGTLEAFQEMDDAQILALCAFYDMVPLLEAEQERLEAFVGRDMSALTDQEIADGLGSLSVEPLVEDWTEEEMDGMFDELARYVGVTMRRNTGAW